MTHPAPDPVYSRTQYAPKISFGSEIAKLSPEVIDFVIAAAVFAGFNLIGWGLVYLA